MKKTALILGLLFCFITLGASAYEINANAKTKRIPAGTKLEVEMAKDVTSKESSLGDGFSAYLTRDVRTQTTMILPRGTIVRGSIRRIIDPKRPYKAGILYLAFDHVVSPNGVQLPIKAGISGMLPIDETGGIKGGVNYGGKVKQNAAKSKSIVKDSVKWGVDSGENLFHGGKFLVVPFSSIGGVIAAGGYFTGVSIADLFKRGSDVNIEKGTVFEITLLQPLDVAVSE